jgi:hypothetical protein
MFPKNNIGGSLAVFYQVGIAVQTLVWSPITPATRFAARMERRRSDTKAAPLFTPRRTPPASPGLSASTTIEVGDDQDSKTSR